MSDIVNPRDLLLQGAPTRLGVVSLPPNVVIPGVQPDGTAPPGPINFQAAGSFTHVMFTHDPALFSEGHGYARTNIYAKILTNDVLPTFAEAARLTSFTGTIFAHPMSPGISMRVWATWESRDGVESIPAGGVNGLFVKTDQDVNVFLTALEGQLSQSQLNTSLSSRIDLIGDVADGTVNSRIERTEEIFRSALVQEAIERNKIIAAIGSGGNLMGNPEFAVNLGGWGWGAGFVTSNIRTGRNIAPEWTLAPGTAFIEAIGDEGNFPYSEVQTSPFVIQPNTPYEYSIYTGAHDCQVSAFIYWYDSAGLIVGNSPQMFNNEEARGGTSIESFKRLWSFGIAPPNAVTARAMVRKEKTKAGRPSSYAFFTRAYFGVATATQTEPTAYTSGGGGTLAAAVQTEALARATETGELYAQYTVKVDVNGYVSGYGLASTLRNGVPTSEFIIRADTFAIAPVDTDPNASDGSPFFYRTVGSTINGAFIPPGAYMKNAFIHDASITNAKIANLAVDDAKIATVSVAKLTAGSMRFDSYIASSNFINNVQGLALWGDGNVQFNNMRARGEINTGHYNGYGWPANGGGGAHLSERGMLLGNPQVGRYFQLTEWGDLYAPQFSIVNGSATFSGNLSAVNGTFSGVLTAAAINAVNTKNIVPDAVTKMISASGGASASAVMYIPPGETLRVAMTASCIEAASLSLYIDGVLVAGVTAEVRSTYADISDAGTWYYYAEPAIAMGTANVSGGPGGRNITCTVVAPATFLSPGGTTTPECTFYALGTLR